MITFILRDMQILARMTNHIQAEMGRALAAGRPLQVDIQPEVRKRSTRANRRHWAIIHQIQEQAEHIGQVFEDETWHRHFCGMFIGKVEMPDGSFTYVSSTTLDPAEFSEFDEKIIAHVSSPPYRFTITEPDLPGRP